MTLFCRNQVEENGTCLCLEKLVQGRSVCKCPYTVESLAWVEGEFVPQLNPQPNADGVCRDFESIENLSLIMSENYVG